MNIIQRPSSFIREKPGVYWVLAENESNSSPGKIHEVRTSQRDGKTYCTCRGWVVALNAGHSICCHIRDLKLALPAQEVIVMDKVSYAAFRRGISLASAVISDVTVLRRK